MFEPTTQTRRKSHTPKHAHTSTHTHSVTHGYTHHHTCSSRMRLYDRSRYVRFPNRSRFSMRDILFLSSRRKVRLRKAAKSGEMDGIALPCRCKCSSSFSLAVHAAQNAMHKQGKGEERKGRAHALLEAVRRGQLVPIRFQFLQLLQAVQPVDRLQHIPGQIQTAQLRVLRRGGGRRGKGCHGRATATNALTWCTLPRRGHPRCRSRGRGGPMRTHCCPLALPGWPAGRTRTQAGVGAHATVVDQGGTVTTASALMRVPGRLSSSLGSGVPGTGDGLGEGLGPLRGLLARGSALAAPARMPPESCKNGHGHPAACVGARVRAALQRPCGW